MPKPWSQQHEDLTATGRDVSIGALQLLCYQETLTVYICPQRDVLFIDQPQQVTGYGLWMTGVDFNMQSGDAACGAGITTLLKDMGFGWVGPVTSHL